ncbi:integrase, catalytic region, zinc finger, CCHC-type containing protein [Tanacetum coccineum]
MSQDIRLTVMNSMSLNNDYVNVKMQKCELCEKCLNLHAELSKSKQAYNDLLKNYSQLEKHCIYLEVSMQLKQEVFQKDESYVSQNTVEIPEYFEINDLKARLQDKDMTICELKDTIKSLRENTKEENVDHDKCEFEPINKELENRVKCSTSNCGSKPPGNKKNDRISQTPSRNKKNKVEAQPRKVNKMNRVVKHVCNVDVKQSMSNANSDILRATYNKSMFNGVHNKCLLDLVDQIVLWYLDSGCSKHMTGNRSQLMNFVSKFLGIVRFENDQIARIMGYGDYQLGNVVISKVYYVEGLGHNLFSVGKFCDADLEVAFRKNTCFIRNLEGVDLLSGPRDTNLYTISLDDMLKSSSICLLSKASKTKSWLWHRQLSHLNFDTLNKLAKDGLARGILRLKFQKNHLCLACALGKSKKSSHQPKAEDTNQEKLYLLHMDLCGPMRVASIN